MSVSTITSANSFIGNGVDSSITLPLPNFAEINTNKYFATTQTFKRSNTSNYECIWSIEDTNAAFPKETLFYILLTPTGAIQVLMRGTTTTAGNLNKRKFFVSNESGFDDGLSHEITMTFDFSDPANQIKINVDGVLLTYTGGDNQDIGEFIVTADMFNIGKVDNIYYFGGETYELYWSTNPLAIDKATIIQYATGEEHFTQAAPDVVASEFNSFIGNGVDSYILETDNTTITPFFGASFRFKLDTIQTTQMLFDSSNNANNLNCGDIYVQGGIVYMRYADGSNDAGQSAQGNPILVDTEYHIYIHTNTANNRIFDLWLNGVPITMVYPSTPPTPSLNNLLQQDQITHGAGYLPNTNTFRLFTDGEMWDFQYSFDSNFSLESSRLQYFETYDGTNRPYATSNEQFTQVAPDALPADWKNGAVQGNVKDGWLGGAVQGEIFFETVEEFLVEVSKIDISSQEQYVTVTDLIIEVLTLEINSPEQYIKITTPVEGPSIVEVVSLESTITVNDELIANESTIEVSSPEQYAGTTDYCTMPSDYFNYSTSCHENEKKLYDKLVSEAFDQHGIKCDYYVVDFSTDNEQVLGEDNDKHIVRNFKVKVYFETPPEDRQYDGFGISDLDTFSMHASKAAFQAYSKSYVPMMGDLIRPQYNGVIYEIVNVVDTDEQFLNSQHTWRFSVRVWVNEKPTTDDTITEETSATYDGDIIEPIAEQTSATDILEQNELVDEEIKDIGFNNNNGNPFGGW